MKKQLEENEKAMKAMQQSYEEKLAQAKNQVNVCICSIALLSFCCCHFDEFLCFKMRFKS